MLNFRQLLKYRYIIALADRKKAIIKSIVVVYEPIHISTHMYV